ncbi:hypothetical protein PQBR44_0091 (plasmid) [Pseudomonas putida UWC1]|nr:hypothetical protein PQBR44_0091 [Pseudomonas putida UWC1]
MTCTNEACWERREEGMGGTLPIRGFGSDDDPATDNLLSKMG